MGHEYHKKQEYKGIVIKWENELYNVFDEKFQTLQGAKNWIDMKVLPIIKNKSILQDILSLLADINGSVLVNAKDPAPHHELDRRSLSIQGRIYDMLHYQKQVSNCIS